MNRLNKLALSIFLAVFSAGNSWASYTLVLQSGHDGAAIDVEWHPRTGTVVSVGEDGRLIVINPEDGLVLHRFKVARGRIQSIRLDPTGTRAAILTSDDGQYTVSVWNWKSEKKIFDYEAQSEPLFVEWSAKGRYIVAGNLGNPRVILLDSRTGRRLRYLFRLPSLYNSGYIGSTESVLMTYASSGNIRYWDIRSSVLKHSAETVPGLTDLSVLQTGDKSAIVARRGSTLYLINRQTGAVLQEMEIAGLIDASADPEDGSIAVLFENPIGSYVRLLTVRQNTMFDLAFDQIDMEIDSRRTPLAVVRGNGKTYLAAEDGGLLVSDATSFRDAINDRHWHPDAFAFHDESLYVGRAGELFRFSSPFFAEDSKGIIDSLGNLSRRRIAGAEDIGEIGIEALSSGELMLWDKTGSRVDEGLLLLDFEDPEAAQTVPVDGNIQKMQVIDYSRVLTVDGTGTVSILNIPVREVSAAYSALGILDAGFSREGNFILAGRSNNDQMGTPLESIDVLSGESTPVPDERFIVYRVVAGPTALYTVGISRSSESRSRTLLLSHDLADPTRTKVLHQTAGEFFDALVLPHGRNGGVFTNLGGEVRRIFGSSRTEFKWNSPISRLRVRGNVLYGLDEDGAMVLWNVNTGAGILRVYFFDGGSWIAIPARGDKIWSSPGTIDNVLLYKRGRRVDPRAVTSVFHLSLRG